ncbi:uncharacterized protein LOC116244818 [Nymphaea colorata]|nr:uncharacterized protein LOC116244818 [Nymphaea colorata]
MEEGLISVDKWTTVSQVYFLTHLHSDHTQGLTPKWSKGPLYCSPITARLFPVRFPGFDMLLVRVLEAGKPQTLTLVSRSSHSKVLVEVTAIDARHCPGALMYLFRGQFGSVLYTGDFRWEIGDMKAVEGKNILLNALGDKKLDLLYMDNTYCNPSFSFPPRKVAAQQVVDIMTSHPHHDFVIGVDNLGKEDLLLHISQMLNTKIWVWPERLRVMHLLGFEDAFTTKTCLTRVRAVPRYSLTFETIESLNTVRPTIAILPTGLPWGKKFLDQKSLSYSCVSLCKEGSDIFAETGHSSEIFKSPRKLHQHMFAVSYSEHSCFKEIEEFLKYVNPSRISGIVSSAFCCINPRHYLDHLCKDESDNLCCKDSRGKLGLSVAWKAESVLECDKAFGIDKQINISGLLKGCKLRADSPKVLGVQRSMISKIRRRVRGVKIDHNDNFY